MTGKAVVGILFIVVSHIAEGDDAGADNQHDDNPFNKFNK